MRVDRKTTKTLALFASAIALLALLSAPASGAPENVQRNDGLYVYSHYDAARDPRADLAAAIQRAQAGGKHVLVEVGGDWCGWCMILDNYIAMHRDLRDALASSFVIVKVNVARPGDNAAFLSAYPHIEAYPALLVLDGSGRFVEATDLSTLQGDDGYSFEHMMAYAHRWAPRAEPSGS